MKRIKKHSKTILIAVSCLLVGKYVLQPKQEIKIIEVVKYIEKKQESSNTKKTTKVKETKNPDGTFTTETTISEDYSSNSSSSVASSRETAKVISRGRAISFGILAIKDTTNFNKQADYGIVATTPIFGSLAITTMFDTSKRIGLGVSLEF